ncbi:putative ferric-chelate reductase 1 homolog [Onthophagus taurus]|uniref:putative ferric-chelate reductase 1 homolog n=1 Tax=Onthophagus taurus TaxID=166361 RepID=UPI000C209A9F|nr:putative ferric-chelate reductase 1 homolog [Onthophagus taurus]
MFSLHLQKLILIYTLINNVQPLPDGAPPIVCATMMPNHSGVTPQTTESPYILQLKPNILGVLVTIGREDFEGFMLQARNPNGQIIGTFEPTPNLIKTIDCDGSTDNSVTHWSTSQKKNLEIQWHSNSYEGPVTFNATVAQNYATFWVGIQSPTIQVSRSKITSNTTPYFKAEPKTESSTEFDPFYDGCGTKKTCFGAPDGCLQSKNCKAIVAVNVYGERYEFELKSHNTASWVGVGLSQDDKMGDDSVIECVKDSSGGVQAYMSWTNPRPNLGVFRPNDQRGIKLLSSSIEDGAIFCRVQRDAITTVNDVQFDLVNTKYNLLVAAGKSIDANKVGYHDVSRLASGDKLLLSDISSLEGASKILLRLHGAFMLAAWLGTASIGVLLARYYRQTWVGTTMCGKDLWFAWHRFFMILTWSLTIAGFILIFVELKAWSSEDNPHAILGIITTILCFIQPIGAYFRPHPGTSKRPIFNWLHWLCGNVAHILAIVTIFFAVRLTKAELPEWMDWILVGFVALHVIIHIVLSILNAASEKQAERRVTSFPMKDLGGSGRTSAYSDRGGDAPYSKLRKTLLALYIILILCIVIVLVFISVVAPVEAFWDKVKSQIQTDGN